jgi:DNA polymerase III subunit alpha
MSADMNNTDNVHTFFDDCAPNQVTVLPPDINQSVYQFKPLECQTILYGLGAVKGTGLAAIEIDLGSTDKRVLLKDL